MQIEKRAQILGLLVEGNSMRATSLLANCSINTVTKLLVDVGAACSEYQDKAMRNITCMRIQCDGIWSFCYNKERNVASEQESILGFGDVWTWTATVLDTKLVPFFMIGKCDFQYAQAFIDDLASRLPNRVQLTTDSQKVYLDAVDDAVGRDIDYSILVKHYSNPSGDAPSQKHCSPSNFEGAAKCHITGSPDEKLASTSYVERQNLTLCMSKRRPTFLTSGISKKVENLKYMVALHFMNYNFGRIHKSLRVTPAMEAGISDHVWSLEEIAALVPEPVPAKRGNNRK